MSLPPAEKPKRKVPLGAPIVWTDAEMDALSAVAPEDLEAARQWWEQNAAPRYRGMLDAPEDAVANP